MIDPAREALAVGTSVGLISSYWLFITLKLRKDPHYTVYAENRRARADWVRFIVQDPGRGLLAVQTLRNSTMAATFFASTAVLLMVGTMNLALQSESVLKLLHPEIGFEEAHSEIWLVKILLLISTFFVAFLTFALSVRLFNHVGYLINVAAVDRAADEGVKRVAAYMTRAGLYYTVGMRSYYMAVPMVFWMFGPTYLVVSTVLLLVGLYYMDRSPRT